MSVGGSQFLYTLCSEIITAIDRFMMSIGLSWTENPNQNRVLDNFGHHFLVL